MGGPILSASLKTSLPAFPGHPVPLGGFLLQFSLHSVRQSQYLTSAQKVHSPVQAGDLSILTAEQTGSEFQLCTGWWEICSLQSSMTCPNWKPIKPGEAVCLVLCDNTPSMHSLTSPRDLGVVSSATPVLSYLPFYPGCIDDTCIC